MIIQLTNLDIEDLLKTADHTGGCPYYASRRSLPFLQLVLLPYNLILNRSSREALGIDLTVTKAYWYHIESSGDL